MAEKGKRYDKGSGLYGGSGLVGCLMLQPPVATAIAQVRAVAGKQQAGQAAPPTPEQTLHNVQADVAEIKESAKQ
jgi:hypothetical protein